MRVTITGIVAIHLIVTLWHGRAHQLLAVKLPPEKNAFVLIVIVLAPVVSAILVWTRHVGAGVWIFFLSMLASFLFGAYHHCLLVSDDHIQHLPSGSVNAQSAFIASAAALALLELASTLYGAFCLGRMRGKAWAARG
jgi:hypothetical protein